ncbi:MAG: hypothetical protein QOF70_3058 [Acetobacteraceae bacterium]|jgi:hypothetical protein|nr:hypothetical protein [Acetobacteraceae bacterium]
MEAEITSRAIAFIKQNAKAGKPFFAGCLSPMLVPRPAKVDEYESQQRIQKLAGYRKRWSVIGCRLRSVGLAVAIVAGSGLAARADQGGLSFWLPGQYGSFAAVAPAPGFSMPLVFYNYGGTVSRGVALPVGHLLSAGLSGSFDGLFIVPTYTPDTTVLGARPNFSLAFAPAYSDSSAIVGLGPFSASRSDSLFGGSDLYPTAQLYWNVGMHNFMTYLAGDIPVGSYNPNRLSNIGIGHGAIDIGGAYTYLNEKTGTEVSATLGFTRNFENHSTDYTNGTDAHLDLGAAQFLNEHFFVGVVGYYYQQLTADRGQLAILGPNESRTRGVGPQIGYNFNVGGVSIYTNVRGYTEFESYRRVQGHSIYFTVNLPLSALLRGHSQ